MGLSLSNFTGDPFAITTISFGIISWVVTLAGAASSNQSNFPHFSWWGIAYQIVIILIIFALYANNNIELYKFTLVGLVSIAFLYTTNTTNNLIYNSDSSGNLCCAAGSILLSILNLIWILYFGGHPESPTNQFIDSFSIKNHGHEHLGNTNPVSKAEVQAYDDIGANNQDYRRYVSPVHIPDAPQGPLRLGSQQGTPSGNANTTMQPPNMGGSAIHTPQGAASNHNNNNNTYMTSSHLTGLENFSSQDVPGSGATGRDLTNNSGGNKRNTIYTDSETGTGITFRYKAKALYSYDANPDDINEISFVKDEILEVDDIDGKWWQARRANGQVGICPSNYVKLLDT
ncbi:High osmolarity signaling protein SHO1 [Candida viswanathii]|uniref:High osmolarity signaling protein SHO1 n=1 Tax=Candida viswanathii TaxID=5486 RepID=A0A367YDU4_9ASCO|nr:High osmolarity signaling protein SHO1 [Candida viswanathii]